MTRVRRYTANASCPGPPKSLSIVPLSLREPSPTPPIPLCTSVMAAQPSTTARLPVDALFTKGLPKIEVLLQPPWFRVKAPSDAQTSVRCIANPATQLHAHLTGSISRQCLHDIWQTKKARHPAFDLQDPLVAIPTGKVDYDIKT